MAGHIKISHWPSWSRSRATTPSWLTHRRRHGAWQPRLLASGGRWVDISTWSISSATRGPFAGPRPSGNVRSNRALRCAFTTLGWWTANLACELFSWMYPDQYVRLCYEDLARSPREAVSRLFQKLLVEGEVQFEALGRAPNRHQLHGNRMRRRPLSLGEIKEDRAWSSGMPLAHRRLVEVL